MTHKMSMLTMALLALAMAMVGIGGAVDAHAAARFPQLAWSPTTSPHTYDFGTIPSWGGKQVIFTLTNTGSGSTELVGWIELSGSSAFTITHDECLGRVLRGNHHCPIFVLYEPKSSGQNESATLTATGNSSASLTLIGKADVDPNFTLSPGTYERSEYGTNFYRYGFSGSATTRFTVTNSSDVPSLPLSIHCISVRPAVPGGCVSQPFTLTNETCLNRILAPGESCTFDLEFTQLATCPDGQYLAHINAWGNTTSFYSSMSVSGACP